MEYNSFYPAPPGQLPPPQSMMNNPHDCGPPMGAQMMSSNGPPPPPPNMIHSSPAPQMPPQNMRHTPGPPPMQQQQQHMQVMPPQQQPSPHHGYHQLPPHPPLPHSASPHPSTTPHLQLQPSPRPSTGPSPMHHQQSPVHMNGPSPKIHQMPMSLPPMQQQQQQSDQISMGPNGPPPPHPMSAGGGLQLMSSPGIGNQGPPPPIGQNPNFMGGGGGPMPPHPNPHYGQPMNHQCPPHSLPPPPPAMHPPPPPHQHPGMPPHQHAPRPYVSHHMHHPAVIDRGSPLHQHIPQTEFRIIELNKRLQNRPPQSRVSPQPTVAALNESNWWERFASDFFDDSSSITLRVPADDKQPETEYTIGRTLIPRFFRSYFEGGVTDLTIKLRNIKEIVHHPNLVTLECHQTDISTKNIFKHPAIDGPMNVVVNTEGFLSIEFVNSFDNLLIKSWRFYTNYCREYVDRNMTTANLPNICLTESVTRYGLTKSTIAYLKMCMIMEPMQELMLFHQQTKSDPKTCLKQLLLNKYNVKTSIDDTRIQPTKRKRRKAPANVGATGTTKKGRANANNMNGTNVIGNNNIGFQNNLMPVSDPGRQPNMPPLASQDVLVVGEPSMLGADFGDENERRITRLENNQFDSPSINGAPNSNHNNNVSDGRLSQTPNSMSNSNSSSQIVTHQNSMQQNSMMQQNNYDSATGGNMQQMMNHNNNSHTGVSNVASSVNNTNNNGIPECAPDTPNSGNSGNCLQNNTSVTTNCNNHQMNLIPMNSNTNHINHITKSEMDSKQPMTTIATSTSVTDTEAR